MQVEGIPLDDGLKNASEQFSRMVGKGLETPGQFFFEAMYEKSGTPIGYLWLGIQERLGRKVVSINDIFINIPNSGYGLGKALMKCVERRQRKPAHSGLDFTFFNTMRPPERFIKVWALKSQV